MNQQMPLPSPMPAPKFVSCEISEALSRSLSGILPPGSSFVVNVVAKSSMNGLQATLGMTISKPKDILTEQQKLAVQQLANTLGATIGLAVKAVLMPEKSPRPSSLAGDYQER